MSEMTDGQFNKAVDALETKLVELLHDDGNDMDVGMHAMAELLATSSKAVGMSEFDTINAFVTIVKAVYKEES
jgi:hypothetical protein